jgi:nucleoside phosphorylase
MLHFTVKNEILMERHDQPFDICILCALYEEARAVIQEFSMHCEVSFAKGWSSIDHAEYRYALLPNKRGERLAVLVTWLPKNGPVHTAQYLKSLLLEFHPRFAAMTGICAGDQEKVKLGDLVVASAAYHYEEGKVVSGSTGEVLHQRETTMVHPTDQMLQYVRGFEDWQAPVAALKRRLLADAQPSQRHIDVIASGMAVRADDPFSWLREHYHRNTVALDMEAASFYETLRTFPTIHGLVVKGVCDYADLRKDDGYHEYAGRVSAIYLLHFLQEYVTKETMSLHDISPVSEQIDQSLWTVPFPHHPFFTGQESVLAQLAQLLRTDQSAALTQPQAITGLGGIGKTLIAVEYAWQHRQDYQYILWSRADTHEALASGYVALAGYLDLPEKHERDQTITIQAVKRWLGKQNGWLLILDGVENLALLEDFLPAERLGHLLLTTRMQATGILARPLEVEAMLPDVGATLLLRRARLIATNAWLDAASLADATAARAISKALGGLPLALDQAGAYLEETHCGLVAYQNLLHSQPSLLLKRRGSSGYDYPAAVTTTWSLSFAKVELQNPAAAEILRCCAFLHPDAIPEELFTKGAAHLGTELRKMGRDPLAFDEAVHTLLSYSLIRRDASMATLSIHRLVQVVLRNTLPIKDRKRWQG